MASLDGAEASLRVVSLPAGAAKRAAEVLPFELESLLPFAPEDAVIDHQPVDQQGTEVRLLAAAVPKDKVATRLAELTEAGAEPRELAVGAAALDGVVVLAPTLVTSEPQLIVEVGNEATDICLLVNGHCEMARTLSTGVAQARSGALEAELKRTMVAYRAAGGAAPTRILLAGDVAVDANAPGWLEEKLGAPVSQLPLPPGPGAGEGGIGRFARAAALAGRATTRGKRIDLRIGEFAPSRKGGAIARNARVIALCAATLMLSFMFSIYARWSVLDDENEALTAELSHETQEAFGDPAETAAEARDLITRGPRTRDPLPRFDAYDVLDAISLEDSDRHHAQHAALAHRARRGRARRAVRASRTRGERGRARSHRVGARDPRVRPHHHSRPRDPRPRQRRPELHDRGGREVPWRPRARRRSAPPEGHLMILSPIDTARTAYENLTEREKRLVTLLGMVVGVVLLFLPLWLVTSAISDIEDENAEIRAVLRDLARERPEIARREAERQAAERRYDSPAPPLGSFLEERARAAGYDHPLEVDDQPDKVEGGFTRRHVRASLQNVGLRTTIDALTEVENSRHPVAIESLEFQHYQNGDRYNVNIGVIAFDRDRPAAASASERTTARARGRGEAAGPPSP